MIDGALHVEHGARGLERLDHAERDVGIADADEAVAHRAEDRLDHDVAELAHGRHRVRRPLADDGLDRGQPGFLQQRAGVELVHGALDGARRVDDRHAAFLDPVQRVHAVDDLLERAAGNDARQHGVGLEQRHALRT